MKKLICLVLFSILFLTYSSGYVCVIKDKNYKEYDKVLEGIESVVSGTVITDAKEEGYEEKIANSDLIVPIGKSALNIAKEYDKPILSTLIKDIKKGPNIKGGIYLSPDYNSFFKSISECFIGLKRVGVIYCSDDYEKKLLEVKEIAKKYKISIVSKKIAKPELFGKEMELISNDVDIIWYDFDSSVISSIGLKVLTLLSFKKKMPIVTMSENLVKSGCSFGMVPGYYQIGVETGKLVNLYLKDQEISFQKNKNFEFLINLIILSKLGIKIPVEFLSKARIVTK